MTRFKQRLEEYEKALNRLCDAIENDDLTDIHRDGILQRFEFTFELAWKTLKDYLEYTGIEITSCSPREIFKTAYAEGIITEGDLYINMMISRNEISHIYDYDMSINIYNDIKEKYITLLVKLKEKLSDVE